MIAIKAMSVEETYSILIVASTAKNQTWIKPENKDENGKTWKVENKLRKVDRMSDWMFDRM